MNQCLAKVEQHFLQEVLEMLDHDEVNLLILTGIMLKNDR